MHLLPRRESLSITGRLRCFRRLSVLPVSGHAPGKGSFRCERLVGGQKFRSALPGEWFLQGPPGSPDRTFRLGRFACAQEYHGFRSPNEGASRSGTVGEVVQRALFRGLLPKKNGMRRLLGLFVNPCYSVCVVLFLHWHLFLISQGQDPT